MKVKIRQHGGSSSQLRSVPRVRSIFRLRAKNPQDGRVLPAEDNSPRNPAGPSLTTGSLQPLW